MITQQQIKQLDELQQKHNNGRGVSCVKTIIAYLNQGKLKEAKLTYTCENDKIKNYKDIKKWFLNNFGCAIHNTVNCNNELCKSMELIFS